MSSHWWKKGIGILLALLLCFNFLPAPVLSAYAEDPEGAEAPPSVETVESATPFDEELNDTEAPSDEEVVAKTETPSEGATAPSGTESTDDAGAKPAPDKNAASTTAPSGQEDPAGEEAPAEKAMPYYLSITHTIDIDGTPYTASETIALTEGDLASGSYDLARHAMEKEGMAPLHFYCADEEEGLVEKKAVSAADFVQAGDPDDGSAYRALQVVIEYRMLEGYRAVVSSGSGGADDPYGIMPLSSFTGSNIKDITFIPANIITVRLNFQYSPTGGLAGVDAAPTQVYQMEVPNVKRDENGNVVSAGTLSKIYPVPHFDASDPSTSALEGFRIVLNPAPLNAYVNDPALAQQAMEGKLTPAQIQEALNSDAFSVSTSDPARPVYEWQAQGSKPPDSYLAYPVNGIYQNRFSTQYNKAWEAARELTGDFKAHIASTPAQANQGANPLSNPMLTFSLTGEQCVRALNSEDAELTIDIYYRRNAGFYNVAHWVPHTSLSSEEIEAYKQQYPDFNGDKGKFRRDGLVMVYLERKQGRVGALTNAQPYPKEKENLLRSFVPQPFVQNVINTDTTRIDIFYDIAGSYSLVFLTDGSYIPRQQVNKNDTVAFSTTADVKMSVKKPDGTVSAATDYRNPTRQGYEFAGWKYEVKTIPSDAADPDQDGKFYRPGETNYYTQENGKSYRSVLTGNGALTGDEAANAWVLSEDILSNAVAVQDSSGDHSKIIHLSPIWTPDEANVRVVFWTEDLGGDSKDVKVDLSEKSDALPYYKNLPKDYLNGTPETVGANFSNVGSFTFRAPTGAKLNLGVTGMALSTTSSGTFAPTGETEEVKRKATGGLTKLINYMFGVRMPSEAVSSGDPINTSKFYHAYRVEDQVEGDDPVEYTVAADGSTVINVYFARNVYTLNFTYYGTITEGTGKKTGPHHSGNPGLVVATNTIGYTMGGGKGGYDYQYLVNNASTNLNRWELVNLSASESKWTVPRTVTIQAKYNADLRDAWPTTNHETIPLTKQSDDNEGNDTAVFVSWAATAGPFSQAYRTAYSDHRNAESTIMGAYRSMRADIIAEPANPSVPHNLYAYWWNQVLSYYRFNTCYEIPGLTWSVLQSDSNMENMKTINLRKDMAEPALDFNVKGKPYSVGNNPLYNYAGQQPYNGQNNFDQHITDAEAERRDTIYLVPAAGVLRSYFNDFEGELIRFDAQGKESPSGAYYAVRRISTSDASKIYAIARHVMASSSNFIEAQAPSAETHMTPMKVIYQVTEETTKREVYPDHSSRVWDDWGRTVTPVNDAGNKGFVQVGSPENPYDLYYYYDRERFQIHYLVPAKDSKSGEYEYGTSETIFGESLGKHRVVLNANDKGKYSDDGKFGWTPTSNATNPGSLGLNDASLNGAGHAAIVPDSAQGSRGAWTFKGWFLDRAANVSADPIWNAHVSGNLRVFALWEPPQYQVKFDFDGGTYNGASTFDIQKVAANVGYTSSGNPIPSPTKPGYDFAGWTWHESTSTSGEPVAGAEIDFNFERPITQDLVLTANWVSNVKQTYRYKIWYLTDDAKATPAAKPGGAEGDWLDAGRWGTPRPDASHSTFTHVLGCQYFDAQELPDNTALSLVAESIPGYLPAHVSATLTPKRESGTNAATTENVAYFYYRKSPVKTYKIRYQLYDKTGEDGIISHLTTESQIADDAYFSPNNRAWHNLKAAGYQLVQMDADGNTVWDSGQPIPAKSYLDMADFIDARNAEFAAMDRGSEAIITFKVAPIPYVISYQVGTVDGEDELGDEESQTLRDAMQKALDELNGDAPHEAAAAQDNPTRYLVTDFADGFSLMLTNPKPVANPVNPEESWEFTGWSLGPGTTVRSRSAEDIYPQLELEESVGDLVFLANWRKVEAGNPENPNPGDQGAQTSSDDSPDSKDKGLPLARTGDATATLAMVVAGIALCSLAVLVALRAANRPRRKNQDR